MKNRKSTVEACLATTRRIASEPAAGPSVATRRNVLRAMTLAAPAFGCVGLTGYGGAEAATPPGPEWQRHPSLEAAGFSTAKIKAMEATLYPYETSSMMIVKGGRIAYTYGDITTPSYLASARKSILSMLYGNYVVNGTINLDRTLGELGIDDIGMLTPLEKSARIRDILTARSGVYHPAGSPGSSANAPARGSKTPGTYFFYNNWDFNVAGAIFEKLAGKTIFAAFRDEIAAPLQLQDFDFSRQRMLGFQPVRSLYQAYHFFLSCRDMARLGLLAANGGTWNGKQVVPASWIQEMTATRVTAAETGTESGYAYLWWKPGETRTSAQWRGASMALGNYGNNILVLPALDAVIVHRRYVTDEFAIARNLGDTLVDKPGISTAQFLAACDLIVGAQA